MRTHVAVISAIALAFHCGWPAACSAGPPSVETVSHGARVTVDAQRHWIAGTRFWMAVAMQNETKHEIKGPVLETAPFDFRGYSYVLRIQGTTQIVAKGECNVKSVLTSTDPTFDGEGREIQSVAFAPHFKIGKQEGLRLLVSAPWPKGKDVEPGDYDLDVTVHAVLGRVGPAASLRVEVVKPDPEDEQLISALPPETEGGRGGAGLCRLAEATLSPTLIQRSGLSFEQLLAKLYTSNTPLDELDMESMCEGVPKVFQPEMAVLKYEVLRRKNEDAKAARLREDTIGRHPGIEFRFRNVDEGHGPITMGRKRHMSCGIAPSVRRAR